MFKLVGILSYLCVCWLLWKISKNLTSVVLFAFNPLVIIELLVSGHNDGVMMALVLGSLLCVKNKRWITAIILFIASIFIKYATLALVPIIFYMIWRYIKNQKISWDKIYLLSFIAMGIIFLLSPLREEIYPWYAIWFLPFAFLLSKNKVLIWFTVIFSFSLELRYIPFMLLGNYFGPTPIIKILFTVIPVVLYILFLTIQKIWQRE